jgi:hypothetical protein
MRRKVSIWVAGVARREEAMPEEHHLLFQRALRVDHAPPQRRRGNVHLAGLVEIGEGAEEYVFLKVWGLLGVEELFQRSLVTFRQRGLEFVADCPEAGTPEQVTHELDLAELLLLCRTIDCHGIPSTSEMTARADVRATVEHSIMIVNAPCMVYTWASIGSREPCPLRLQ